MSKNSIYTFDYFQPEEYRFSLDSVFLAQRVIKHLDGRGPISEYNFLDLCAGCGVIGLEMMILNRDITHFDFVEIQEVYREYFAKNIKGIFETPPTTINFIYANYQNLRTPENQNKYDIIVCNPPYFFKDEGLLSPSEFKNRCRFFLDSNLEELIKTVHYVLKENGEAFLLIRPGKHHGRELINEVQTILEPLNGKAEIFDEVRGTNIVRLLKKL